MNRKISIIVPIYNAEKTLNRCIDSVIKQKFNNYELILINDGSSDASAMICNEYLSKHPQIRYEYKKNGGVSSARNYGIELSCGEYVAFLDSDDFLADDYFETVSKILSERNPDLLSFSSKKFGGKSDVCFADNRFCENDVSISRAVLKAMKSYSYSSVMARVFKRSIIVENNIVFDEALSIGEDQAFLFEFTLHAKTFASADDILYMIDVSSEISLSRKKRDYLSEQLPYVHKKMLDCLKSAELSNGAFKNYYAALSWMFYRSAYSCFIELIKYDYAFAQRLDEINKICNEFKKIKIEPSGLKCKIIALPVKMNACRFINMIIDIKAFLKHKIRV